MTFKVRSVVTDHDPSQRSVGTELKGGTVFRIIE
jgi:hypothetical protein